jgi:hypothetical protein
MEHTLKRVKELTDIQATDLQKEYKRSFLIGENHSIGMLKTRLLKSCFFNFIVMEQKKGDRLNCKDQPVSLLLNLLSNRRAFALRSSNGNCV